MNEKLIRNGFILAGLVNIFGALIFSKFFSNDLVTALDPVTFSDFGFLMIIVWGFAYISVANDYAHVKYLVAVFSIEKLIYGLVWIGWLLENNLSEVFEKDFLTGLHYSIYGANDLAFFLFFGYVFFKLRD